MAEDTQTNDRSTPLLMAARYGDIKVMHTLLEHGANVVDTVGGSW